MKFLNLVVFVCFAICTRAQQSPAQQYVKNLDSFYRFTPLEKTFLHTDKEWYFPGETIWFKSYVTVDNELNEFSHIVYVDLSDAKGNVIEKTRWPLKQMHARGDIYLSKNLSPGNYMLRAYTMYMLNYPEVIDEKIITVLSDSIAANKKDTAKYQPHLYILPEGGNMILNTPSKVAYKITFPNQLPLQQTTITVFDNDNTVVYSGAPMHDGMGFFYITPAEGKTYKLKFDFNGITYTRNLPPAETSGLVMEVNNTNANKIFLSIKTNNSQQYPSVLVMAQMNGVTIYAQNYDLAEGSSGGAIDKRNLPNGAVTITCFNTNMQPLSERVVYINRFVPKDPGFEMKSLNTAAKTKNEFTLNNLPDSASLSIAITDADKSETGYINHNIITYFLLGSEVKGYIHNPTFYFRKKDSATNAALDLLMLTNGWRRFKTEDVVKGKMSNIRFYPETGIAITGTVKDQYRKKLNTGGIVNAIIKTEDSTTIYTDAVFSENGKFVISGLDFKKKAKMYLKEIPEHKGLTTALDIDAAYIDTVRLAQHSKHQLYKLQVDSALATKNPLAVKFDYKKTNPNELAEIVITGKKLSKEQQITEEYATEQFKYSEYTYILDSNIAYNSLWQYLQANVPGLTVGTGMDPNVNFSRNTGLRDASTGADNTFVEDVNGGKSSIAFFLNEVLVPIESITDLQPKDVALIKVNRNPSIGLNAMHGSIFVYTRKGALYGRGYNQKTISGYSTAREYFNPVYETPESKSLADYRSTLLWNPELKITGKQTQIQFYNNDVTKRFRVIVCGLDKDGFPIYMERIIE
ncbi:MAG: hypothetical protein ACK5DG_08300 [Chitinophagaceae bacterium]|jgi:hypothetical protein